MAKSSFTALGLVLFAAALIGCGRVAAKEEVLAEAAYQIQESVGEQTDPGAGDPEPTATPPDEADPGEESYPPACSYVLYVEPVCCDVDQFPSECPTAWTQASCEEAFGACQQIRCKLTVTNLPACCANPESVCTVVSSSSGWCPAGLVGRCDLEVL